MSVARDVYGRGPLRASLLAQGTPMTRRHLALRRLESLIGTAVENPVRRSAGVSAFRKFAI